MTRSMMALSVLVIIALIFGTYRSTSQVRVEKQKIAKLKVEIASLRQEIQLLRLEVSSLSTDTVIESLARERLGMRLPDPGQIISLPDPYIDEARAE